MQIICFAHQHFIDLINKRRIASNLCVYVGMYMGELSHTKAYTSYIYIWRKWKYLERTYRQICKYNKNLLSNKYAANNNMKRYRSIDIDRTAISRWENNIIKSPEIIISIVILRVVTGANLAY